MFLKRIELFGFKSFMNKITVAFGEGTTCVIGPNGCGKSNISDAIRWVLGEQNPRLLRGETMDDIIFNGTRTRRPLGMAEVSLVLSNDTHAFPIDYAEIKVTRRVYRSGLSEYLINKNPCRLKDIRNLLMDTGLGSSAYTVMERSMTDQLLGNTSTNLRIMLEEAAGIMKYKTQEKAALRSLDATEGDLVRIRDIVAEVEKRVRSLKRQIGKANRYNELSDSIRLLALAGGRLELERLAGESDEKRARFDSIRDRHEEISGRLAGLDAEVEKETLNLRSREEGLKTAQNALDITLGRIERIASSQLVLEERTSGISERRARLEREIEEANARIRETVESRQAKLAERDEASKQIEEAEAGLLGRRDQNAAVQSEVEKAKDRLLAKKQVALDLFRGESDKRNELGNLETALKSLETRDERLKSQLGALEAENEPHEAQERRAAELAKERSREVTRLREERDQAELDLEQLRTERAEVSEKVILLQGKKESLQSTLALLTRLRDEFEGYRHGVRTLLTDEHGKDSVLGVVGELMDVEPAEYLPAFENAIGDALQCVVVSEEADALELLRFLREGEKGWATLLPRDRFRLLHDEMPDDLKNRPGVIGSASQFVRSGEATEDVIRFLLGEVILVNDMDTARALAHEERYRLFRFVTPAGEGARYPGLLFGGGSTGDHMGIFERRSRISEIEEELSGVTVDLKKGEIRKRDLDESFDRNRIERDQLIRTLDESVSRAEEAARGKERIHTALGKGREAIGRVRIEIEEITREKGRLRTQISTVSKEFESIGAHGNEADRSLREIEAEMVEFEMKREESRKILTAAQVALAEMKGRLRSLESEVHSLERRETELTEEIGRKQDDREQFATTLQEIAATVSGLKEEEAGLSEKKERETEIRDEVLVLVNRISDEIRERSESARGDRKAREAYAEEMHALEMRLQEIGIGRINLLERVEEEFGLSETEIREADIDVDSVADRTEAEMKEELHTLRESVKRLGPVNLVALDEFDEENDRYEFLTEQEEDLIQARDSLRETVAAVDLKARSLFLDTFQKVRKNFSEVFRTLFQEGEADLIMVDEANPLESDLEIVARPGQKRAQRIALLSGGERALTAISVLFALYLEKPSPFCILDELDAPLDDANVGRFLEMVKRFGKRTQFVVITHNRQTMEAANYLYGVTMQESGVSRVVSVRLGDEAVENEDEAIRSIQGGSAQVAS